MDRKRVLPILLIIFTNILGAGVILPILPLYAEGQFGGSVQQITLLASAFFGAQFLAAPWLGRLSDRYGRRPILIVSQIGTILAFILFIFAGELGQIIEGMGLGLPISGGMFMLFVARTLDGITGGNITTAQAYISDITPEEKRAEGLGMLQAAFGAGFIFGPAFGGILSNYGSAMPFIGATIITSITLLITIFSLKESLNPEDRSKATKGNKERSSIPWSAILSDRALVLLLLIGFTGSLAFSALPATFALYANSLLIGEGTPLNQVQLYIGLMLTFNGLIQVLTQITALRPLIARLGERSLLVLGQAAIALSLFGFSVASTALVVTLFFAPFAFGYGVSEPSTQALVTRFGDKKSRGYLLGLYQSARSLALILGPIWAGAIYTAYSPSTVYAVGGIVMLMSFVGSIFLKRLPIQQIKASES